MPPVFKALASIAAWALFVVGALSLLTAFIRILGAALGTSDSPGVALMTAYFGYGFSGLFLSVVAMKLRKDLE